MISGSLPPPEACTRLVCPPPEATYSPQGGGTFADLGMEARN